MYVDVGLAEKYAVANPGTSDPTQYYDAIGTGTYGATLMFSKAIARLVAATVNGQAKYVDLLAEVGAKAENSVVFADETNSDEPVPPLVRNDRQVPDQLEP
jgi:hypothetical protein